MNPGMLFDEVLESHEFRLSDTVKCEQQATSAQNMQISPIMQTYWTLYTRDKRGG